MAVGKVDKAFLGIIYDVFDEISYQNWADNVSHSTSEQNLRDLVSHLALSTMVLSVQIHRFTDVILLSVRVNSWHRWLISLCARWFEDQNFITKKAIPTVLALCKKRRENVPLC